MDNEIYRTKQNTYTLTRYEQEEEQREERLYSIGQKLLGLALIITGIVASIYADDGGLFIICFILGLGTIATKDHIT